MNNFFISNNYNFSSHKIVSVMAVVRSNIDAITTMIKNVFGTCSNPKNVEMLLRMDDDDNDIELLVQCEEFNRYNVKLYVGERYGYLGMNKYFNELVTKTTGDIIFHWGDDGEILTHNWENILSKYAGKVMILQNLMHYTTSVGMRGIEKNHFSPVVPRIVYDILGGYSPCALSDAYYDYVGEIAGIIECSGINVWSENDNINSHGGEAWEHFRDIENMDRIEHDAQKVISYLESNDIPRREIPYFLLEFKFHPRLEIRGGPRYHKYRIDFIDRSNMEVMFSRSLPRYNWVACTIQDFTPWLIRVSNEKEEIIFEEYFNLEGKEISIKMESKNTDELWTWIEYIKNFRDRHKCEVSCITYYPELFDKESEGMEFYDMISYDREELNRYAFFELIDGMSHQQIEKRLGLNG